MQRGLVAHLLATGRDDQAVAVRRHSQAWGMT